GRLPGIPQEAPPGLLEAMLFPDRSGVRGVVGGILTTPVASDGKFEFSTVTPGSYDLRMRSGSSSGISAAATRIRVDDRDVTDVTTPAAAIVFGRVTMEGGSLPNLPTNVAGPLATSGSTFISIGAGKLGDCCPPTFAVRPDGWFAALLRSDKPQGE